MGSFILFLVLFQFVASNSLPPIRKDLWDYGRDPRAVSYWQGATKRVNPSVIFWSYYDNIKTMDKDPTVQGAYLRDSPQAWSGLPQIELLNKTTNRLMPGQHLSIVRGPRRKRNDEEGQSRTTVIAQRLKDFWDMPLFCWKFLINCRIFKRHICCPVMPKKKKPSTRTKRMVVDPMFGIPIVASSNSNELKVGQVWKPYSPYYIGLPGSRPPIIQKRCQMSKEMCLRDPQNPCCNVDRFFPIGPNVQPTLFENWMSALFEFSAKNPVAFTVVKKITIVILVAIATLMWGSLGHQLGIIRLMKQPEQAADRMDNFLEDLGEQIEVAIDEENWMEKLNKFHPAKHVICCFTNKDHKVLKCTQTTGRLRNNRLMNSLKCVSDLIYDIKLNQENEIKRRMD